jgi:hypothetical protein
MNEVSVFRLNLLRAMYLLVVVGLSLIVWPGVILKSQSWGLNQGVINCMLVAFSLLCALGIRYPLQMLPVLLWELIWKSVWLGIVALPKFLAGTMDQDTTASAIEIMVVVLIPFVIPWGYFFANYFGKPAEPWRAEGKSALAR